MLALMVGIIQIALGQLRDFTGYQSAFANRVAQARIQP